MPVLTLDVGKVLYAVFIRRALNLAGVRVGSCCSNMATTPLAPGVAMLVPLSRK